jgi:hypothetical protein
MPLLSLFMGSGDDEYLAREARARKEIDRQLSAAGWVVQSREALNLSAGRGSRFGSSSWPSRMAGWITCCSLMAGRPG